MPRRRGSSTASAPPLPGLCPPAFSVVSTLLGSWQPYLLAAAGITGMVLAQSAFQAGPLDASLPACQPRTPSSVCHRCQSRSGSRCVRDPSYDAEVLSFSAIVAGISCWPTPTL